MIDALYEGVAAFKGAELRGSPQEHAALMTATRKINDLTVEIKTLDALDPLPEIGLDGPTGALESKLQDYRDMLSKVVGRYTPDEVERRKALAVQVGLDPDDQTDTTSDIRIVPEDQRTKIVNKEYRVFLPDEKIETPDFNFGRVARALCNRDYMGDLNNEERTAVLAQDSLGGITVPSEMSTAIIEPLRARTVIAANSQTVIMPKLNLSMVGSEGPQNRYVCKNQRGAYTSKQCCRDDRE